MKIENFEEKLKECKRQYSGRKYTSDYSKEVKLKKFKGGFTIDSSDKCKTCGHIEHTFLVFEFNRDTKPKLTIFEVGLLVALYKHKEVPIDYADYHKCVAGKRFIESLGEIDHICFLERVKDEN